MPTERTERGGEGEEDERVTKRENEAADLVLHLQAWGTKGSTTIKDLGGAKKSKGDDGKELVEVSIPTAEADIDELWLNMRKDISTPAVVKHEKRSLDGELDQPSHLSARTTC